MFSCPMQQMQMGLFLFVSQGVPDIVDGECTLNLYQYLKTSYSTCSTEICTKMDTNAVGEPTQEIEGPSTQTAGGTKPLHRFLRGEPRTVGIVLLLLGLCLFLFGIPLKGQILDTSADNYSPFWLGILYIICGVLYIQSERNTTKKIVTVSLAFSIIAILGTIVGAITFCRTLVYTSHFYYMTQYTETEEDMDPHMSYLQVYSLEAVFLFHSLVAGVILIAMTVFARLALRSSHTQMLVVMHYPPSAE